VTDVPEFPTLTCPLHEAPAMTDHTPISMREYFWRKAQAELQTPAPHRDGYITDYWLRELMKWLANGPDPL
jgi:hypothetical protein